MKGGGLIHALTRNIAETSPDSDDPRLRGRTYAVPFDTVWQTALALAGGGLGGWSVRSADDLSGIINAKSSATLMGAADVKIRVSLDADGQTRIDARSVTRTRRADLGTNARRLNRFFRALDRKLIEGRPPGASAPAPPGRAAQTTSDGEVTGKGRR